MGAALANKNKTLGQVQKHIAREQYDRAIKLLKQLVEEDPNDVRSLLKLGDVYVKKGERDVAVDVYKQVAKQYSEQGFFMKAVAIYKQILKHQGKNVEALMQLAELYEHLGLASEARQQYLLAESVLQEAGDAGAALALMQKQVELDPDNVAHRIKLAEAYSSHDNVAAATRQFAAAAEVLRRQNREEDFIKVAERLVYHDPNRPEILRDLARLYLARGDAKRALAKLQLCFRSQPKDVETLELLAQAFSELRQYARTKTVYQELVQVLDDKGLVGKAEEYRLLIRQLDEAERPSPVVGDGQVLSAFQEASPPPRAESIFGGEPVLPAHHAAAPSFNGNGIGGHSVSDAPAYPSSILAGHSYADGNDAYADGNDAFSEDSFSDVAPYAGDGSFSSEAYESYDVDAFDISSAHIDAHDGSDPDDHETEGGPAFPLNGASMAEQPGLDDLIIEPPVESGDVSAAPPPPPPPPEASVDQRIANLVRDARVYQRYNLPAGALEQLQHALELDPDNVDVLEQMRDLYMTEGDPARAADVVGELVRVHFRNGDRDAAEQAKRQIAQLAPSHPLAVSVQADALPQAHSPEQREDSLSFVITEDSGSFEIVDVADSGSIPAIEVPDSIVSASIEAAAEAQTGPDLLPDPEFVTGPLLEDDEPLDEFTDDLEQPSSDIDFDDEHAMPDPGAHAGHPHEAHHAAHASHTNGTSHPPPIPEDSRPVPEEDPTTLGDPVAGVDSDDVAAATDDFYDQNGHAPNVELLNMADHISSAAALGSPAGIAAQEASEEPEPVTAHADAPGGFIDLTDELAEVQFFLDVGDEDGAQEALRELLEQHPAHPEVTAFAMALQVEVADVEDETDVPANPVTSEDVQAAFDKALDEAAPDDDPSEVQDAYDEGMALMEIDRTAQAIEKFEQAAEWPSMAATAREMLVRCYAKMDQPAQAVAHYRDAEKHGVSGAAATHLKFLVAACFERTGDLAHALEWYEACAADDPSHHDAQGHAERVSAMLYGTAQSEEALSERRNKISYL